MRKQGRVKPQTYDLYRDWVETRHAAVVPNLAICLIHQAHYLLDQQLSHLEADFRHHGGIRELMSRARLNIRRVNSEG